MKLNRLLYKIRPHLNINNGVMAVAAILAISWMWNTVSAIQRNFKLEQQVDILRQEIAVGELENENLAFQKSYYKSDEFLELSARERLNKALKGERLLILPPNTARPYSPERVRQTEVPIANRSNFAQWMYFLFGRKD